jgi:hypothetical protein
MDVDQMARDYRETGWATAVVTMPEGFIPREVEVLLLRTPFGCEVFLPANVKYTGKTPAWKQLFESAALPGNARHAVTVAGDWADGLAAFLKLRDTPVQMLQETRARSPEDHASLLGIKLPASHEEIKAAFRRLAKVHHPDRLVGAPPAELARAQVTMADLISACHALTGQTARA